MRKFLTLFISLFLFSSIVNAEVDFEFEGFFPNRVIDNLLNSVNGRYSAKNLDFAFDVNGLVEGLSVEKFLFDYDLDIRISLDRDGSLGGYFLLPDAMLKAKKVNLIYETQSNVDGVDVKIKTKLTCEVADLVMKQVGGFIRGQLAIEDGVFLFDKDNAQIELGDFTDAFSIDLKDCQGAKGLEPVIKTELIDWIESDAGKSELLNVITDTFISVINEKMMEFQGAGYQIPMVNKAIRLNIKSGYFLKEGFSFKGRGAFDHEEDLSFDIEEAISIETGKAVFRLPRAFAHKILPMFLKDAENMKLSLERKGIPGVDLLFNNRLVQFFVWSDLMNFRKKSNFDLGINLKPKQVALKSYNKNGFSYHLYSEHQTDLDFKNSQNKIYPYMDFKGELSSSVNFSVNKDGIGLNLNDFRINSDCNWDEDMTSWRKTRPGGKPWMSFILKQAKKGLNGTGFSWKWSDLGLTFVEFKSVETKISNKGLDLVFDI